MFRIGSLFSGSGGFELAATMCGGTPVWASEVEPFPIAVTWSRFPGMKHLGSVTDINGGEVEPVDVITFGSPCQDLSVAGKRAGLKHEDNGDEETTRSGLFMEAIRIIKEMRKATNGEFPKYCCWENVPGAFSSNGGRDFRTVLEELIKIVEPSAVMPEVPKNGWPYADSYCGEGWSLAYRTFDAQYWGVPQRRRRIYLCIQLVPNLGDGSGAGEILFKSTGLRGYFAEGRTPWQGAAGKVTNCPGADDRESEMGERGCGGTDRGIAYTLKIRSGCEGGGKGALIQTDMSATLATNNDQYLFVPITLEPRIAQREGGHIYEGVSGTLRANAGDNQMAVAYGFDQGATRDVGKLFLEEQSKTLTNGSCPGHHNGVVIEQLVLDDQGGQQINVRTDGKAPTLRAEMHGNVPAVMEAVGFDMYNQQVTGNVSRTIKTPVGGDDLPVVCVSSCTYDARGNGDGQTVNTLTGDHNNRITDYSTIVCEPVPIHDQATRFSGKRGSNQDGKGNGLGIGNPGDPMNTLTSGDRHAVAYATDVGWLNSVENQSPTLLARQYEDPHLVCYPEEPPVVLDRAFFNQGQNAQYDPQFYTDGTVPTLVARGPAAVQVRYIVRRLTPTECARLQGFADRWATPIHKDDFTDEEYHFWCDVYRTKLLIDGKVEFDDEGILVHTKSRKPFKDKTKPQMVTWYNNLLTDSSEYKLWGNGIALPNALYVMQGIADVLNNQ